VVNLQPETFLGLAALFVSLLLVFSFAAGFRHWRERSATKGFLSDSLLRPVVANVGLITLALCVGNPLVNRYFPDKTQSLIADLQVSRLSDRDNRLLVRGYYEDLTGVNRFNTELWGLYMKRPHDWPGLAKSGAARKLDLSILELIPSKTTVFKGERLTVNRWGMRDQDYERLPTHNTLRIALLGGSYVMAAGVADEETFEWLLEERLNKPDQKRTQRKYEILNFAVSQHGPLENLWVFENRALPFEPNAVFYVASRHEKDFLTHFLVKRVLAGAVIPYDYLAEVTQRLRSVRVTTESEATRHLKPHGDDMLAWVYRRIVEISRLRGLTPYWTYLPLPELKKPPQAETAKLEGLASEAGFEVLNLADVYDDEDIRSLWVAPWDNHPNTEGHLLIAHRLYADLAKEGTVINDSPSSSEKLVR
jgi:hypothetical protein